MRPRDELHSTGVLGCCEVLCRSVISLLGAKLMVLTAPLISVRKLRGSLVHVVLGSICLFQSDSCAPFPFYRRGEKTANETT